MGSTCSKADVALSIDVMDRIVSLAKVLVQEDNKPLAKKILASSNIAKEVRNDILSNTK